MVRTRTIREAAVYFREKDPQTCLTETAIRTLLRTGAVPSVRVGKRNTLSHWRSWNAILQAKWSLLKQRINPYQRQRRSGKSDRVKLESTKSFIGVRK